MMWALAAVLGLLPLHWRSVPVSSLTMSQRYLASESGTFYIATCDGATVAVLQTLDTRVRGRPVAVQFLFDGAKMRRLKSDTGVMMLYKRQIDRFPLFDNAVVKNTRLS